MNPEYLILEKGQIFMVTRGEYSDFEVFALLRALQEFDLKALNAEWMESFNAAALDFPELARRKHEEAMHFVPWLIRKGYAKEVEHRTVHTVNLGVIR